MADVIPWLFVLPPSVVIVVGLVSFAMKRTSGGRAHQLLTEGGQHLHRKEFDEAERLFRQGLEINPGHTGLLGTLASLLVSQEKYEDAEPLLNKALSSKADARLTLVKGRMLLQTSREEEGVELLRSLPEDADIFLDAQGLLAEHYEKGDDIPAALDAVKAAIRVGTVHQRRPFKKELKRLEALLPQDGDTDAS